MKKLVLFFAVAFAMSFAACTPKAGDNTEVADTLAVDTTGVDPVVVADTVAADTLQ